MTEDRKLGILSGLAIGLTLTGAIFSGIGKSDDPDVRVDWTKVSTVDGKARQRIIDVGSTNCVLQTDLLHSDKGVKDRFVPCDTKL